MTASPLSVGDGTDPDLRAVLEDYGRIIHAPDIPEMDAARAALQRRWAELVEELGVVQVDSLAPWDKAPFSYARTAAEPSWAHWRCPVCGGVEPDPWTFNETSPKAVGRWERVVGVPRCRDVGHAPTVMELVLGPRDWLAELRIRLAAVPKGWLPEALEHDAYDNEGPAVHFPWRIRGLVDFTQEAEEGDHWPEARLIAHAHADLTRAVEEIERLRSASVLGFLQAELARTATTDTGA